MAEISTTQAFSDGDTVTATKLNNITANASIQADAITNRSAETTVDQANDLLLMYDASASALKKVTLSNAIKAGTASNFPVTGNATIGGTLGVTGASTLSSTLGVSDTISATKASGTGLAVTSNATVGGTLGVTGVLSAASTLELGHASDTTLSRGSAGRLQVEGVDVPTISSTDTLTNKTLTSPVISGGTINNAAIGGTTAAAGSFTTLSATSSLTLNSVKVDAFPTGTVLLFYQASAPTGWTQVTTQNNKALRVVSGTGGGTGGSTSFTSVFASRTPSTPSGSVSVSGTVGNTTLTINQIPAHTHGMGQTVKRNAGSSDADLSGGALYNSANNISTDSEGGGQSHNHSWSGSATFSGSAMSAMDFAVQYIDVILASKNA